MGALIRDRDWTDTPLGGPETWPQSLRSALSICIHSSFPTAIYWGPELRLLYNDAWAPIPAERHPWALGRRAEEVWSDIWHIVGPQLRDVIAHGESVSLFDQLLPMVRGGVAQETYWNYSFTPIRGEDGSVMGVFNQGNETTAAVLARRQAEAEVDRLGRLFAQAPGAVAILQGPRHVFEMVNPAYERLVGRRDLLGRPVAEALPEIESQGFIDLLDKVYATGESHVGRAAPVLLRRCGADVPEERLVDFVFQPLTDAEGARNGVFVQAADVSDAARALAALGESEAKFHAIVNSIDQMIWSTRPDGHHDYYNNRWYEFTGVPEGSTDGEAWNGMFHPDDQERAWRLWSQCLATGEPYHIEYRLRHRSGRYRWVIGRAQCVRDDAGRITRWFGSCTDVHDLKTAEEERQLLVRELNHRVKNLFAIASGMVSMTARSSPTVEAMSEALRGRLNALAKAHELIRPAITEDDVHEESACLRTLVEQVAAPHLDGADAGQLSVSGPDVTLSLSPATSFALILHEFATNAAKYGALATAGGRLGIAWRISDEHLELDWDERVPECGVGEPCSHGFGSRLARSSATGQLGGTITYDWRPQGVRIALRVPVDRLSR